MTEFSPDWISPPGDTISDLLKRRRSSPASLAAALGREVHDLDRLLLGEDQIDDRTASALAKFFGMSPEFWQRREEQYQADFARLNPPTWLAELPVGDMIKFHWVEDGDSSKKVRACLHFFGVPTVAKWRESYGNILNSIPFRRSQAFASTVGATAAWLRVGEVKAQSAKCGDWNPQRFRASLVDARPLTRRHDPKDFLRKLYDLCSDCGVAVEVVRAPKGCTASGATKFVAPNKALLLLSFRHLSEDHFWFTFFHEAAHLLLHDGRRTFIDGVEPEASKEETEANNFASEVLIPIDHRAEMLGLPCDAKAIVKFAQRIGISPGIVVGQLQHFGKVPRNHFNGLKRRYSWD